LITFSKLKNQIEYYKKYRCKCKNYLVDEEFHKQTVAYSNKNSEIFLKKFPEMRILPVFLKISGKNSCQAKVFHISNFWFFNRVIGVFE